MTDRPDPMLLDIPSQIETERLILRVPRPGDGPVIYEAVQESLANLRLWLPWAQGEYTPERAEEFARQSAVGFLRRESLFMLIFRKEDGHFLGGTGLDNLHWDVPSFEIGYWIRAGAQGQGYVSEATRAVTGFCFATLDAERVEIRCDARNMRSAAVAERCGFTRELCLRRWLRDAQGALADFLIYSMIRDEWLARPHP